MAENTRNQNDPSNTANKDQNRNEGGRENTTNQQGNFDNPQDGSAWDNYRTRSLSSNAGDDNANEESAGAGTGKSEKSDRQDQEKR